MSAIPADPAAVPALHVPKNYYIATLDSGHFLVPEGRARRLVISAVAAGASVTLTRVGGGDVTFDAAMLRAHQSGSPVADGEGGETFGSMLEYEYAGFAATNCTGFLVGV